MGVFAMFFAGPCPHPKKTIERENGSFAIFLNRSSYLSDKLSQPSFTAISPTDKILEPLIS